ncbi:MAG: PAC2 family protein [Candidatus Bathyarchaeota archaeon]|nr:PAC2 family protein [Candidatus Bathyarchaeota archaeon]
MVCSIKLDEIPQLNNPILIEGLPGIGFVANITALHLIKTLGAKRFGEIVSASFQDLAILTEDGDAQSPINELYYVKREDGGRDLLIWFGNTQALTTPGQYELTGKVLDIVQNLGCQFVVSLGGFKKDEVTTAPSLYCAASDEETLKEALSLDMGHKVMVGHIFGIAGLALGLSRLRGMRGFALLVDTVGMEPDPTAARVALTAINRYLKLNVDLSDVEETATQTKSMLEAFGLIRDIQEEKKKEEQELRWFI